MELVPNGSAFGSENIYVNLSHTEQAVVTTCAFLDSWHRGPDCVSTQNIAQTVTQIIEIKVILSSWLKYTQAHTRKYRPVNFVRTKSCRISFWNTLLGPSSVIFVGFKCKYRICFGLITPSCAFLAVRNPLIYTAHLSLQHSNEISRRAPLSAKLSRNRQCWLELSDSNSIIRFSNAEIFLLHFPNLQSRAQSCLTVFRRHKMWSR